MTQTAQTTVAVAAAIRPTITFSTFSPPPSPASADVPKPTAKPYLHLVE
jgi:hypothetical protein